MHLAGARVQSEGEIESVLAVFPRMVNDISSPTNVKIHHEKIKAVSDIDVDIQSDSVSVVTIYV